MATVLPYLFYISGLWFQHSGGIMPLLANFIATVILFVYSIILGSCCHSLGGIILLNANSIATVQPSLVVISELWYHYFGGIIPSSAKVIATVKPS